MRLNAGVIDDYEYIERGKDVPPGHTLTTEGIVVPAIVQFEALPESTTGRIDGAVVEIIGYALDTAGLWHPVVFDEDSPLPRTIRRGP